jgi:exodeoxyribonuclease VII small subunit
MKEFKFEEALKKLEEIVQKLEDGNIPLEKSLELFEEGTKMAKFCSKKLEEAETKIKTLAKDSDGKFELKGFEEDK